MKPLRRKLITVGKSKAITIPVEYCKQQRKQDGYILVFVPTDDEIKQRGLE